MKGHKMLAIVLLLFFGIVLYTIVVSRSNNRVSVILGGADGAFVDSDSIVFSDPNYVEPEADEGSEKLVWPDIDLTASNIVPKNLYTVVNDDNKLSSAFMPDVVKIPGFRMMFDATVIDHLNDLIQALYDAGFHVYIGGAYRSFSFQTELFNGKASQIALGYGITDYNDPKYQDAVEEAKLITMFPGASEHQLGTCVDLFDKSYSYLSYEKMNHEFYDWLDAHCAEYGFIKRYPTKKLLLTGWDEPWHYRYVGVEAATFIMENDICYEEFYAHYNPDFTYG